MLPLLLQVLNVLMGLDRGLLELGLYMRTNLAGPNYVDVPATQPRSRHQQVMLLLHACPLLQIGEHFATFLVQANYWPNGCGEIKRN